MHKLVKIWGSMLFVLTLKTACRFESFKRDPFLLLVISFFFNSFAHVYMSIQTVKIFLLQILWHFKNSLGEETHKTQLTVSYQDYSSKYCQLGDLWVSSVTRQQLFSLHMRMVDFSKSNSCFVGWKSANLSGVWSEHCTFVQMQY